jgi:hypothetical protein
VRALRAALDADARALRSHGQALARTFLSGFTQAFAARLAL